LRNGANVLLILATTVNGGAASVQAPFYQGKTIQEGHRTARRCDDRMKTIIGD